MKSRIALVSSGNRHVSFTAIAQLILKAGQELGTTQLFAVDPNTPESLGFQCNRSNHLLKTNAHLAVGLELFRPDVIIYYYDLFPANIYLDTICKYCSRHEKRCMAYLPIDGLPHKPFFLDPFSKVDKLVFFHEVFQKQVTSMTQSEKQYLQFANVEMGSIHHPVPTSNICNLKLSSTEKNQTLRRLVNDWRGNSHSICILNGNRCVSRKRMDITILAFEKLLEEGRVDSYLFLHRVRFQDFFNLYPHVELKPNIRKRIYFQDDFTSKTFLTEHQLNSLYNCCEIGVNTASGEGWGLVSSEHAKTGASQVTSGSTTFRTIWQHFALHGTIEYCRDSDRIYGIGEEVCSVHSIVKQLKKLCLNSTLRKRQSNLALLFAQEEMPDTKSFVNLWSHEIKSQCKAIKGTHLRGREKQQRVQRKSSSFLWNKTSW